MSAAEYPLKVVRVEEILPYIQRDYSMRKAEAARYLGIGVSTLEQHLAEIPHYRLFGKTLVFKKSDLDAFLARNIERPEQDITKLADDVLKRLGVR